MKVSPIPPTRSNFGGGLRESSKQRALRIVLDYHRRGDRLVRSKYFWTFVAALIAAGYVGWLVFGGAAAREQLSPGQLAAVHSTLNSQCSECHQDFTPLGEQAEGSRLLLAGFNNTESMHQAHDKVSCAKCHPGQAEHPHHSNQLATDNTSCAACHIDHQGASSKLVRTSDQACTRCHQDIAAHRSNSLFAQPIQNVASFAKSLAGEFQHPPFRSLPKTDVNHFRFNHQLHLLPGQWPKDGKPEGAWKLGQITEGLRERYRTSPNQPLEALVQLDCKSCHETEQPDSGATAGAYMLPIDFERHCRACHPLQVAKTDAGQVRSWNIRHGLKQKELREVLLGISAEPFGPKGAAEPATRLPPNVPIPGKTPGDNLAQNLGDPGQVDAWQRSLFRDQCQKCHADESPSPAALTEPADFVSPQLTQRWFAHARFNHRTHAAWANCRDCHAAAYATEHAHKPPLDDQRVLVPNIDNCVQCHAPRSSHVTFRAAARFDCAECHRYHAEEKH